MTYKVMEGPETKLYESFAAGLINMMAYLEAAEDRETKQAIGASLVNMAQSLDNGEIPEPRFPILTVVRKDEAQAESVPEDTVGDPAEETSEEAPAEEASEEAPAEEASEEAPAEEASEESNS